MAKEEFTTGFKTLLSRLAAVFACLSLMVASLALWSCDTLDTEAGEMPSTTDEAVSSTYAAAFDMSLVPPYNGEPSAVINGDEPFFTVDELNRDVFEEYSPLDVLGRCGTAFALVGKEMMPEEERGAIGMIKPSGWQTPISKYDFVDGKYLYNRCHLLGFQLTGENDNELNFITGTRTLNTEGMLPLEEMVDDFVDDTGMHVLMRVTPVFEGDNLLASGVLMEARSIEDNGEGVRFCRYAYNVEPGVVIDYSTGANWAEGEEAPSQETNTGSESEAQQTYILNTNSHKFHLPGCKSASSIKDANRQEITATRSDVIAMGYVPCGSCQP